jgi:hypothetical protein
MSSISPFNLLSAWETGLFQSPAERGLTLLSLIKPQSRPDDLARLPMGSRDCLLLGLRERLFGPHFLGLIPCPECEETLEISFQTGDVLLNPALEPKETHSLSVRGYDILFRPPTSLDLIRSGGLDVESLKGNLIELCIEVAHEGQALKPDQIPGDILDMVIKAMADCDPQADVQLELKCPFCGCEKLVIFDILHFLWTEIEAWAQRTLEEIHLLALAYGWSEADILAMSPLRRQAYLELVGG